MDGAFSAHRKMKRAYRFWLKGLMGRNRSKILGVGARVILKWFWGKANPTVNTPERFNTYLKLT